MVIFGYTAVNDRRLRLTGTITCDTAGEGRQRLRERGLRILRFAPAASQKLRLSTIYGRTRRRDQVSESARYLSLLLHAGVPLAEALSVLARRTSRGMSQVLLDVRERICGGASLADALSVYPVWFDTLFVSAVRVGELTGRLDETLYELSGHLQSSQKLRQQLAGALIYPAILVIVGVGVVLFLMSYVVPQLLAVLSAAGRPLPASTAWLKSLSDGLIAYWPWLLLGVVVLASSAGAILRTPRGRFVWQRFLLQLPLAGSLVAKQAVAAFAQHLSLLLRTGVPFVDAARTVSRLVANRVLAGELEAMADAVSTGSDIAPTMADSRVFPPVVAHLVAVGQDSGELPAMLQELRVRYETEVQLALGKLTAAIEPLLIVLLAAGVGFVVYACLVPILELTRGIA